MTKNEVRYIWMQGFHNSGEGFNGEYPFGSTLIVTEKLQTMYEKLEAEFEDWYDTKFNSSTGTT